MKKRIWIFNLTRNFLPFFIPLAEKLEEYGHIPRWWSFWPGEQIMLRLYGQKENIIDWQSSWLKKKSEVSREFIDDCLSTDPYFASLPVDQKKAKRPLYEVFAGHFHHTLGDLVRTEKPDCMLIWNPYKFKERLLEAFCKVNDIPCLFFENGFFPDTLQIDPVGVNAGSSLGQRSREDWLAFSSESEKRFGEFMKNRGKLPAPGKDLENYITEPPLVKRMKSFAGSYLARRSIYSTIPRGRSLWEKFRQERFIKKNKASLKSVQNMTLPDSFIFLPLQVHDDTQIIVHSPWIRSMEDMVEKVAKVCGALKLSQSIVVKEHPVDVGRYNYKDLEKRSDLVWLRDYPVDELLEKADCIVTVNSSVGTQALVFGKPVVALGEAYYNVEGLVHHAESEDMLAECIRTALDVQFDEKFRNSFLCRLRFHDLVEASWKNPTDKGIENTAQRIIKFLKEQ